MDVLIFENSEYRLTISTASIEYAWERFERRVKDAAPRYCDYRSSSEGNLSLYYPFGDNRDIQGLNPEVSAEEWLNRHPVVFETCEYQFAVEFRNIWDTSDAKRLPKVRHQIKTVGESFKFYPNGKYSGILVGSIDFLNSPGKFSFAFEYRDGTGQMVKQSFELYVASPKLDTKSDLQKITSLINEEYENYVFDYLTLTFSSFSLKRSERNNSIIWLSIFKTVVDEYFRGVRYIISCPNNKSVRKTYHARPDRIRRWSQREEERYRNLGADAEKHFFRYEQAENTVNTRENRFVKYSLHILGKKFREVFNEVSSLYGDMDAEERNRLNEYNRDFRRMEAHGFFRKVGEFEGFRQESSILQQRTGYSQIYKSWLMLKNSLDLVNGKTDVGMKKIWELYEIWCFLVMKRLIAKVLHLELSDAEHVRENKAEMINTMQKSEMTHVVEFDNISNGDVVRLEYQHTYNRKSKDVRTTTTEQRPDIVVTIRKPDGFVLTYLYDAKYRVQDDRKDGELDEGADIDMADYPLPDAINQMHRYRDAIYYAIKEDERPHGKEIIGGYILFPGRAEGTSIYNRYFYKSIETVNIGAFPLLPADRDSGELVQCPLLEEHLTSILQDNSAYEQIKDSIPQKGLTYSLKPGEADSLVLVGYVKKKDKELILSNKMYYTRAEFELGSLRLRPGFEWTEYMLLYDADTDEKWLYKLNNRGPRIASRQALVEKGFTPKHGDFFFVFDMVESEQPVRIDSKIILPKGNKKYEPFFIAVNELNQK